MNPFDTGPRPMTDRLSKQPEADMERRACVGLDPVGFFIRHPPPAHELREFITPEGKLFQTIHMGAAVVDVEQWRLVVDGLVRHPLVLDLGELKRLPRTSITSFHECFGSPLQPAVKNLWRIGNVTWTGVQLGLLLSMAEPMEGWRFVWSEGLDSGTFANVQADRYQKDLPMDKALSPEVLVAYDMNGQPLGKERGGPVRLVVPGWFGTNSTKWLCKLSLRTTRAMGPYTTTFYNEKDPADPGNGGIQPVWQVAPNSIIVLPRSQSAVSITDLAVEGWAWSHDGVIKVVVTISSKKEEKSSGDIQIDAALSERQDFSWQKFAVGREQLKDIRPGPYTITARATSTSGVQQPLSARRNHVHSIDLTVLSCHLRS